MKIKFITCALSLMLLCNCSESDDNITPDKQNPDTELGVKEEDKTPSKYTDTPDKVHELQEGEEYDWDSYSIPAQAPLGKEWVLSDQSDDFNYTSGRETKSEEFNAKWNARYVKEGWYGPNPTSWRSQNSYVEDGALHLFASREKDAPTVTFIFDSKSYTLPVTNSGCISAKKPHSYPLYVEARSKVAKTCVASAVWMLSNDSSQEIDIIEAYGGDRWTNPWFDPERMHLSHHVFNRTSTGISGDYQPNDEGTFYTDGTNYSDGYHRVGVLWLSNYHLEYYIDGVKVREVKGKEIVDPKNYTENQGLYKPEYIILSQGDQTWRAVNGLTPNADEIKIESNNTFSTDWIRVYEAK